MPKVTPLQSNFNGGEISPLLFGRSDMDRYRASLGRCLNYVPIIQGGLTRRPGTRFVEETKTSSKKARLVPFEFSVTQAYIIEFGDLYIRFYKDNAQILDGGPVEVVTTYTEAQLFQLKFAQSADILYVTHPDHPPRKISRTSDIAWTITDIVFELGPFLEINKTPTTLTPSVTSGTGTITASSIVGINNGEGFKTTDVGRLVRIEQSGINGTATITGFTSTTVVDMEVSPSGFDATTPSAIWRLGVWSDTTGYPATVTFHENRLAFAGSPNEPQRIDLSRSGDFENFEPTDADLTLTASHAISFVLNAGKVNVIRWIVSDEKGLQAGTVGGEWIIRPSSLLEALTPTNVTAKLSTNYGSADIQPTLLGKGIAFIQRAGRKVRELAFFFDVDGFRSTDLTVLAENITKSGVVEIAYQKEPHSVAWCVRNAGDCLGVV